MYQPAYARAESCRDIYMYYGNTVIHLIWYHSHQQIKCACYRKAILQCKAKKQFCLLYK